jgi:hypothetical protein
MSSIARGGGGAGTWFASSFRHPAQQLSMAMERTYIMVRTYCTIVDTCVNLQWASLFLFRSW